MRNPKGFQEASNNGERFLDSRRGKEGRGGELVWSPVCCTLGMYGRGGGGVGHLLDIGGPMVKEEATSTNLDYP